MTTIPHKALVVIADGGKAILFRNIGKDGAPVALHEEQRLTPKDLQGPSGARPDETPSQTEEATFSKQLADTLHTMKNKNDFDAMVLVADPQTLGQLRAAMHKTVMDTIVLSLSKDLTNHSTNDIAAALNK
ncbi:MAG: host attachment family protein [Pseudolabrys sp.]|nr:host attachment family protein [Pseudolabrys sp.]